ncbi:hypothetical protein PVAND_002626 [Polypedilum vanderplanki]|uniref:RNA helicase n=1 Tax=Polypedilum vanderplanki TaxID=319348 RepID=A0A9J6BT62_POLVA|nr:hypothetical protein PVAND_002626 [Polypedilum vanderplanki]
MTEEDDKTVLNFHQMELDDRILKAIAKLGWIRPTLIQEKAIPIILEKRDVLIQAKTGSGKTASFLIPVIQKILNSKSSLKEQKVSALIMSPSKLLCQQIDKVLTDLTIKCSKVIKNVNLAAKSQVNAQKHVSQNPDIIISTPARILNLLKQDHVSFKDSLETVVLDEADLLFSCGYKEDVKNILEKYLPSTYQSVLASATLSDEVMDLKKVMLQNSVTLKLEEPELPPITQLAHYYILAEEEEKAAILFTLFKLFLIKGKCIIFVNSVNKCYKLKLFLDQFKIRSCVLNSELPANIRSHTVHEFNVGTYEIIIASDEKTISSKSKIQGGSNNEYGVSRGIDFRCVSNVINFDFPTDVKSYIHRSGRTARGNNKGNVLSFISVSEKNLMDAVEEHLNVSYGDKNIQIIKKHQFKIEDIEPFKYRAHDAWYAVTKSAIREARLKEIKREICNSEKLKSFFENSPRELQVFKHDAPLSIIKPIEHLSEVPDYIVPPQLKNVVGIVTKKHKNYQPKQKRKTYDNPLAVDGKKKKIL